MSELVSDSHRPIASEACPSVSIVIPVLNEAARLPGLIERIRTQSYHRILEVLVVDGGSSDQTRQIASAGGAQLLDNPRRIQAAGLNVGIAAARGEVVVRLDARTRPSVDYVEMCVRALLESEAAVVGGPQLPVGNGWVQRGIAAAMSSRTGGGTAQFRRRGRSGWVDTVYLGAYWTDHARGIGGYSETLRTNEDAEFAFRMGGKGGVWLDARIKSDYIPRESLVLLARQYFDYGVGRASTLRKDPSSGSPRQCVAPMLVVAFVSRRRRVPLIIYGTLVGGATVKSPTRGRSSLAFALALPTMHLAWGFGFWWGLASQLGGERG